MPNRSKTKGNAGENQLCKIFEEVFGGKFKRVFTSGAFTGGANAYRRKSLSESQLASTKGDIHPPGHLPKLVLESKFYKEFAYHQFVSNEPIKMLDGWIGQTLDAVDEGDFWILAFKANRREWAACFDAKHLPTFTLQRYITYVSEEGRTYVVTNLQHFLNTNAAEITKLSQ